MVPQFACGRSCSTTEFLFSVKLHNNCNWSHTGTFTLAKSFVCSSQNTILPTELKLLSINGSSLWVLSFLWLCFTPAFYSKRVKRGGKKEQSVHPPPFSLSLSLSPPVIAAVTWPNKASQEKGSGMLEGERRGCGLHIFPPRFSIIPPSPCWIPLTIPCPTLSLRANDLYLANLLPPSLPPHEK